VYKDAAAVAHHRETPHFKAWAEFKAAGGVLSQEVIKAIAVDFTY
jgi:quinol monooxygenase YgiN